MYTKGNFKDGSKSWKVNKLGKHWNNNSLEHIQIVYNDDAECICDTVYDESDANIISAAPDMYEALKKVEQYLINNEKYLTPFPIRSELDNIRCTLKKAETGK